MISNFVPPVLEKFNYCFATREQKNKKGGGHDLNVAG